jgi:VanZ family protein
VSGPWDFLLRKLGHIFEYFLLTILVARAIDKSILKIDKRGLMLGAVFSLVFAALDEYHQTFIPGRFGVISDVGIDSVGIVLALISLKMFDFLRKK